jgi:hypothetical protein
MTATNAQEIASQAHIMATTGTQVTEDVKAFNRHTSLVKGQTCQGIHPNGHITPEAAIKCAQNRASEALAGASEFMAEMILEGVEVRTFPRFQCSKGCKFGHKSQGQAEACNGQGKASKAPKAQIKVTVAGPLTTSVVKAQAQVKPASKPATVKASAKTGPAKLRSGAQSSAKRA